MQLCRLLKLNSQMQSTVKPMPSRTISHLHHHLHRSQKNLVGGADDKDVPCRLKQSGRRMTKGQLTGQQGSLLRPSQEGILRLLR